MIVTPLLVLMIAAVILAALDRPTPIGAPRFMDPHIDAYARRIADSLAKDKVPARVPTAEAYAIAERYGVWIPLITEETIRRSALAEQIAETTTQPTLF